MSTDLPQQPGDDSNRSSVASDQPLTDKPGGQPTADQQQQTAYPPLPAEQKEAIGSLYKEGEPKVIEKKEFETPKEVKEWVSEVKKEDEIELPVPVEDEYGQILIESARPSKPKIVLPVDHQGIQQGIKRKVNDSVRWLVTWCLRLIKMFPKRVEYQKKKEVNKNA